MADSEAVTKGEARHTVDRLLGALANHPDVFYELVVALRKAKIAGPWVKAKAEGVEIGNGMWRLRAQGPKAHCDSGDVAAVYPSQGLTKPEDYEYAIDYDDEGEIKHWDEERYERDVEEYKTLLPLWKPWTWRVGPHVSGYADTREEAMLLADDHLKSEGWVLADGQIG